MFAEHCAAPLPSRAPNNVRVELSFVAQPFGQLLEQKVPAALAYAALAVASDIGASKMQAAHSGLLQACTGHLTSLMHLTA